MKHIFYFLFFCIPFAVYPQGVTTSKNIKIDFTGFVRNDFIVDSRKNVCACDHLLEFYPYRPVYDDNGEDIYARANAHFLNTFSRFGTRFSGLEIGNAKISAYLEFDFTGFSSTNGVRLRHAYTSIAWPKTTLLFGRAWHPSFIEKVYPSVLNENTGLPFQVFNRSPQLRLTHHLSDNLDFIAGAVYQYNYVNDGPDGKTYRYQREAVVPNLHAQLQFYNKNWVVGAAIDWKSILPRTSTIGINGTFKTDEKLNTWAALAYLKYSKDMFELKAKTMWGQNVSESLLPGGYAVASRDEETGAETYTPLNHIYNWINFTYGKKWKVGLYAGYMKNLGTKDAPYYEGVFYGMATDIDRIYKVSPQLIYFFKNFMVGWEMSWTSAAYGDIDTGDYGKVKNTETVTNFRNLVSVAYNF
ncbi:hypothetical protein [Mariniphaga sediminis]|uniref:hypothetical protein n=1 Tax=Mariniphaga sediminis TaxID=1628158 RepID=UPI00356652DB